MRASYLQVFWRAVFGSLPFTLVGTWMGAQAAGLPWWGALLLVWAWAILLSVVFATIVAQPFMKTPRRRAGLQRRAAPAASRYLKPLPMSLHDLPQGSHPTHRRRR